jgi:ribA/ribD-fused uncharacterized protein
MRYNRLKIENEFRAKGELKFLFFWGHQPSRDGRLGVSCFSQWWPAPFEVDGLCYPTAEHWMMAGKARLFADDQTAARILDAESPKQVKQLGREVRGFDPARWDEERRRIVTEGNVHKFTQNSALGEFLLSTGRRYDGGLTEAKMNCGVNPSKPLRQQVCEGTMLRA